jgi:hypothetical protein
MTIMVAWINTTKRIECLTQDSNKHSPTSNKAIKHMTLQLFSWTFTMPTSSWLQIRPITLFIYIYIYIYIYILNSSSSIYDLSSKFSQPNLELWYKFNFRVMMQMGLGCVFVVGNLLYKYVSNPILNWKHVVGLDEHTTTI